MKNVNISSLTGGEVFDKTFLEKILFKKANFRFFTNVNIINIYYWRKNGV